MFQILDRLGIRGVYAWEDGVRAKPGALFAAIGGPSPGGAIGVLRGIMCSSLNAEGGGSWLLLGKVGSVAILGMLSYVSDSTSFSTSSTMRCILADIEAEAD